jgi:NADH-quinone oxidoreductase subunit M
MVQETLWGPITKDENRTLKDLDAREVLALLPLCALMLWIGVAPRAFLEPSRPALEAVLSSYQERLAAAPADEPHLAPASSRNGSPRTFLASAATGQESQP